MRVLTPWMLSLALLLPTVGRAQSLLDGLSQGMVGPHAKVMVLGTVHLSELPPGFDPDSLKGLLDRLAAYKPDLITIEALSGEECDMAARHAASYGKDYCASTDAARQATGLDLPAALAEVNRQLKSWPAVPEPSQRRHLAALFLAANDQASALTQWLQLSGAERRPGDGLAATLVARLERLEVSPNENYQIAARLAARLGLARVHAVDNHTGDNHDVQDTEAFEREVTAAWAAGSAEAKEREKQVGELSRAKDLLPLYRYVNDPAYLRVLAEVNVRAALQARSTSGYPQIWVAGWETRNLRMVANVREAFRDRVGQRVLVVVGASHKPWFDHWLGQLQGLDIVDVPTTLRPAPTVTQ